MRNITGVALLTSASLLSGCIFGGSGKCETEGRYQMSQSGKHIEAPDDLDELASYKEMTIPRASPREPSGEDTSRCLEMPPGVSLGNDS